MVHSHSLSGADTPDPSRPDTGADRALRFGAGQPAEVGLAPVSHVASDRSRDRAAGAHPGVGRDAGTGTAGLAEVAAGHGSAADSAADGGSPDRPFLVGAPTRARPRRQASAEALSAALGLRALAGGTLMVGVVGSKGKGTAAVYASATLAAAGLKVGTITSPGITSGRERIRIDGQAISPSDYQALGRRLEEFKTADKANAALLEGVSTSGRYLLFGLEHLLRRGCQAAVMEAGIGGASDELSVLPLRYLLMTEVFMEHVGRLGPTLADIARDKLGAASAATAKLYHLPQSEPVVAEITRAAGSGTFEAEEAASAATGHSQRNAALGVTAGLDILRHSGLRPPEARRLEATLRSVSLPGRMTALSASCQAQPLGEGAIGAVPATPAIRVNGLPEGATVLVDSAITRDGLAAALAAAEQLAGGPLDRVFVSVPADKDVAGFAAELADLARRAPGVEVTFVKLESAENLDWPKAESGPWSVRGEDAIGPRMFQGRCAAVGTALFTGAVLRALGLNAETVFTVPLGQASPQPDRPAHREPIP